MNLTGTRKWQQVVWITLFLSVLIIWGFFANEARKEVYFLCKNFTKSTSVENVTGQLATAELSDYVVSASAEGQIIRFSSAINFRVVSCDIQSGADGKVISADYTRPFD